MWSSSGSASSPVCPQRPFGTVWSSNSAEPGSPVIKFNSSLAPGWLLAQDIERQIRAGNPLPGSPHAGIFHAPAAAAPAQEAAAAGSSRATSYQPPVDLVVLSSQLQRLGPSTPFRYTTHHCARPHQQQQQHKEDLLQQQPLLSPPGRAGAAALASSGNVRWAADAGTQTLPHWLAADAARLGEPLPWGSRSCCSSAVHHQHSRSAGSCRTSTMHWQARDNDATQHGMHSSLHTGRPWTAADASIGASNCTCCQHTAAIASCKQEISHSTARQAEGVSYTAFSHGLKDSSSSSISSPWRLARPGHLQAAGAASRCGSQPWLLPGAAAAKATAILEEICCCCTSSSSDNTCYHPAAAVHHTVSATAAVRLRSIDVGSYGGSVIRSSSAGGQLQRIAAPPIHTGSSRRRAGSSLRRRQAAEVARAKARQQLDVSAKYAAIGRAAAAETAAAHEAARKEQQRQQLLQQQARRAAASASQDEIESEHEVDVIITTSPIKECIKHSSLRSSAEAACAAAIAARAAALRSSITGSGSKVQYLPETALAGKACVGGNKTRSINSTVAGSSSSSSSGSRQYNSLRDLMNQQKQVAAAAPNKASSCKHAASLDLRSKRAVAAAASCSSSRASRQLAAVGSKRHPGKPAVWMGHAAPAGAAAAAAGAAVGSEQKVCSSELAVAAEQDAAARRSSRQALLAGLLAEWSDADQFPSCSSEESWALPAGAGQEQQADSAIVAQQDVRAAIAQQAYCYRSSSGSTQSAARALEHMTATPWQPAAAAVAADGRGALAPLLQQPEVELAAGGSISSPRALTAEQIVSRAASLDALCLSCSSNGGVAPASATRSLPSQQEMFAAQQYSWQQGLSEAWQLANGGSQSTAGTAGSSSAAVCAASGSGVAAGLAGTISAVAAGAEPARYAAAAAAALLPAVVPSCQSSFAADLAVAFDENAHLHSLLASSKRSICSRRSSTADVACVTSAADRVNARALEEAEVPHVNYKESALLPAFIAYEDHSRAAAAGNDRFNSPDASELVGAEQRGPDTAIQQQLQQQPGEQQNLPLSQAAAQLMLQEASSAELAVLAPAEATAAAAELASVVLLPEESSTASLAEFEQEIAAMLSRDGAAGGSNSSARVAPRV